MISLNFVAFLHLVAQLAARRNVDTAAGSYPELFAQMLVAWRLGTVATLSEMKKVPGRCWTHADRSSIGKTDKTVEKSFENLQPWQREPRYGPWIRRDACGGPAWWLGQAVRSASVGDSRAARSAGSRPAMAPMAMAAPMPPPQASGGMTIAQCLALA